MDHIFNMIALDRSLTSVVDRSRPSAYDDRRPGIIGLVFPLFGWLEIGGEYRGNISSEPFLI